MERDFYETRREVYARKDWEIPSDTQNQQLQAHSERRVDLLKLYLELDNNREDK